MCSLSLKFAALFGGGESGRNPRRCSVGWIRFILRQAQDTLTPVFVKQLGANAAGLWPDRIVGRHYKAQEHNRKALKRWIKLGRVRRLQDAKGGDPNEWPADLRVREYARAA